MAAPTSLAVGVDLEEYSRFESDKNTVNVTVVAGVPTSDLANATLVGDTTITVEDVTNFPTVFPYAATISLPAAADYETINITNIVGNVVSLTAPLTKAHAKCARVQVVMSFTGEQVLVQLVKARRNRDVVVATEIITLAGTGPTTSTEAFKLTEIVDNQFCNRVRRGMYFIRCISVTNTALIGDSADFRVSILTVDRFKREYLHGADHQALDTEEVKAQPVMVTGVTVDLVSRGHQKGWFPLSYNVSDPSGCGTPVKLLSWCGGPSVAVKAGQQRYTLRKGKSLDYIDVVVLDPNALPAVTTAEDLLIDRQPLTDDFFRDKIEQAISWTEKTALMAYLEPTRVVTEIDQNEITYAPGTDVPTFVNSDFDEKVDAVTYQAPAAGHWLNFRMPYFPVQYFNALYGKVSNVRIVDIALEWIEVNSAGGFVELVPFNQELAYNFIGLMWVGQIRGNIPLPNFWNFDALVGMKETAPAVIELIAKKAAIDALTLIGQAFRPGVSGQSISRDGVSESVSYLSSGMYGIFSGVIKTYTEWMDKNLPMLRGAYKGVNMLVV
jgi:hypothetical protein